MTPVSVPDWLRPLQRAARTAEAAQITRIRTPQAGGGRKSAVLILIGSGTHGADVLLMQRSATMRSHAGQPAFPGGAADPGDDFPVGTALREAAEEVGVDAVGVHVLAVLPELYLPPSGFLVTPVLAWWRDPGEVGVVDVAETQSVSRVPVRELTDPANRFTIRHPSGHTGPAFAVHGMLVWGFTAGLLDGVLRLAGWSRPWDQADVRELPADVLAMAERSSAPR